MMLFGITWLSNLRRISMIRLTNTNLWLSSVLEWSMIRRTIVNIAVQAVFGLVDQQVGNLFKGLGKMSQNLFNNIGNSIGGEIGASLKGLKNQFNSITSQVAGITGIGKQFKGLEIIFKGILKGTEEKLKDALQKTKQTLSDLTKGIKNTFNTIKDELQKKIPFLKRSVVLERNQRELSQCYLNACPDCKKVNLPENPTDAQLEQVMANICGEVYTKQTAVKSKIEKYMDLVGELLKNTTIVEEFWFSYANRVETMERFKFTLMGKTRTYTPKAATEIDTRDITGLGQLIMPIVLKLIGF
ncbi:hypothetical protein KUTeg_009526 [Tegillarca granosa]|uniref:Uncharacterized protein n=1 Tax=Tegillarca granosa TaxID=220873 RepID=A0ABQ9F454_TEGGR|nr:hypothetical protein KUTeg_009526 [Tegillarca granosa]